MIYNVYNHLVQFLFRSPARISRDNASSDITKSTLFLPSYAEIAMPVVCPYSLPPEEKYPENGCPEFLPLYSLYLFSCLNRGDDEAVDTSIRRPARVFYCKFTVKK